MRFKTGAKRVFASPISGAVGWTLSVLWDAFWLMGPLIDYEPPERRRYMVIGFIATIGFTIYAFAALLYRENGIKGERDAALKRLLDGGVNSDLAARLTELRLYGLESIRNEYERNPVRLNRYLKREKKWAVEIESEMRSLGCSEPQISSVIHFTNSEIGQAAVGGRFGPVGDNLIGVVEMRVKRLGVVIEHYAGHKLFI